MAQGNCGKVHPFCHSVWPSAQIWTRDIDTLAPIELITDMAAMTGVSNKAAEKTALRRFEGLLYEKVNIAGQTSEINQIGVYHRTRRLPGLQWCAACLRDDENPYFRQHWRLALFSTCHIHGCILSCLCPSCSKPAVPFRTEGQLCHHCGHDRRKVKKIPARIDVLQFEKYLLDGLNGNEVYLEDSVNIHPYVYFAIIRRLQRLLVSNKRSDRLRAVINDHHNTRIKLKICDKPKLPNTLTSKERHDVSFMLSKLLEDWPHKFIDYCRQSGMYWTWITKDLHPNDVPYLLAKIADLHLSEPRAIRTSLSGY